MSSRNSPVKGHSLGAQRLGLRDHYRQRPVDKVLGHRRGSGFPPGGAVAPHRPAVTFPGTEAESRHLRPARASPLWAAPVCYRGNRGAPSLWAATVSPRHFQIALVPEPLAAAGRTSEDGGSRGRCASRRSGGEARPGEAAGPAGSRGLRGGPHPSPEGRREARALLGGSGGGRRGGSPTVRRSVRPCGRGRPGENCRSTFPAEPGRDCLAAPAHALCGARTLVFCFLNAAASSG